VRLALLIRAHGNDLQAGALDCSVVLYPLLYLLLRIMSIEYQWSLYEETGVEHYLFITTNVVGNSMAPTLPTASHVRRSSRLLPHLVGQGGQYSGTVADCRRMEGENDLALHPAVGRPRPHLWGFSPHMGP